MKIEVAEATPAQLDWLVAKCEGWIYEPGSTRPPFERRLKDGQNFYRATGCPYSTDWTQGGPIIEREQIPICPVIGGGWESEYVCWQGEDDADTRTIRASTPLIAAMRCYVASKLGDEIEVPDELS